MFESQQSNTRLRWKNIYSRILGFARRNHITTTLEISTMKIIKLAVICLAALTAILEYPTLGMRGCRGSRVVRPKSAILRMRGGRWLCALNPPYCASAVGDGRWTMDVTPKSAILRMRGAEGRESRVVMPKSAILRMRGNRGSCVQNPPSCACVVGDGRWTMDVTPKSAIFRMRGGRGWRVVGREAEPPSCSGVNGRVIEILGFAGKNTQSDTRLR